MSSSSLSPTREEKERNSNEDSSSRILIHIHSPPRVKIKEAPPCLVACFDNGPTYRILVHMYRFPKEGDMLWEDWTAISALLNEDKTKQQDMHWIHLCNIILDPGSYWNREFSVPNPIASPTIRCTHFDTTQNVIFLSNVPKFQLK